MEATLYKYYLELEKSTKSLRMLSVMTLLIIMIYILIFITIIFYLPVKNSYDIALISPFILFGLSLGVAGILLLFTYSKKKEKATIIYEELTIGNENYQNTNQNPSNYLNSLKKPSQRSNNFENIEYQRKIDFFASKKSIQTEIKIAIKKFLKTTDLPFAKGKTGETFYLLLFILLILVMGYLKVRYAS